MRIVGNPSARTIDRARATLALYRSGALSARKTTRGCGTRSLEVGLRWRLVKLPGKPWRLMTHEKYNRVVGKRKGQ